ncbi:MAG: formate/nitrite transporter family protein [Caldilineaceae bacterium]|nr:formate/nitrite transporter family protein [Caldilineaceae bacterium]
MTTTGAAPSSQLNADQQANSQSDGQQIAADRTEPRKPARRILEQEIAEGLGEMRRSDSGLFIAGLSAGLDVGFSLFLMATMWTYAHGQLPVPVVNILVANMYSIGFIFVIIGRSELFTEHTALAVLPVLNGRATLSALGRLWGIVYTSNLIGGAIFAVLAVVVGTNLHVIDRAAFGVIAGHVVDHPWWVILLSAVLAGWLMGLLSWLTAAGRDTISQVVLIWLVTTAIGLGRLHHSIVGTVEVLAGYFAGQGITLGDFGHFLVWTTLGNSIGGVVFVGLVKYGHVIRSNEQREEVNLEDQVEETEKER